MKRVVRYVSVPFAENAERVSTKQITYLKVTDLQNKSIESWSQSVQNHSGSALDNVVTFTFCLTNEKCNGMYL